MKKIEFRLYCTECGSILEMGEPEIMVGKDFTILVKPCYKCAAEHGVQADGGASVHTSDCNIHHVNSPSCDCKPRR